jgi:hypothetical protein
MRKIIIFLILIWSSNLHSQSFGDRFEFRDLSIAPFVNYVSSASIQQNPNSTDIIEKNQITELHGGLSYGLSIKKKMFGDDIMLGLSAEYLKIEDDTHTERVFNGPASVNLRVKEIVWVVPVEFSFYYRIPKFTEDFGLYLGGGMGVYFGDRERQIFNMKTETKSKEQALNFHIATGGEYLLGRNLSAVFEVTFREGEYKVKSSFPADQVTINGSRYNIQQDYDSKVFIDGLKLGLGLSYYFN